MEEEKNEVKEKVNETNEKVQKKPKKGRKKLIIILIIALILILLAVSAYIAFFVLKINQPITFNVTATEDSSNGVLVKSAFKIDSNKDTSEDYVKQNFKIEPSISYTVAKTSNTEYEIVPSNDLEGDKIYNVQYTKDDGSTYKWSFQTINTLRVTGAYPKDKSTAIPTNTGIELNFSYKPKDIKTYFEITPNVQGTLASVYNKVTFVPDEPLQPQTLYTITIKKGLGSDETDKVLEQDYTTSFMTASSSDASKNLIYGIADLNSFTTNNISGISYYRSSNLSETEKMNVTLYAYKTEQDFVNSFADEVNIPEWAQDSSKGINVNLTKLNKITSYDTTVSENAGKIKLPILSQGYYMVEIKIGSQEFYTNVQVNDTMALVNCYSGTANIWVNNGNTNKPVSNATILYNDKEIGKTDANGSYIISNLTLNEAGKDKLQIKADGNPTLYMYEYFYSYESDVNNATVSYIYSDKELYRTGETINVWGFAKNRNNTPINSVTLSITDGSDNTIEKTDVTLDELGGFNTTFDLTGFTEGYYYINVISGGRTIHSRYIEVKKYTDMNYIIDAKADQQVVYRGEKVNIEVQAVMFDGTIASNLSLHYTCSDLNIEGDVKTDKNGIAEISIDTSNSDPNNIDYADVQIDNTNLDSWNESTNVDFRILPGNENIAVTNNIDKNNKINFTVNTYLFDKTKKDYIGEATSRIVTLSVDEYTWEKVVTGSYYDDVTKTTQQTYTTVKKFDGTTNYTVITENGVGVLSIDNPFVNGEDFWMDISAQTRDDNNNLIQRPDCDYLYPNYTSLDSFSQYSMDNTTDSYHVRDDINLNITTPNDNPIRTMYLIDTVDGMETIFNDGANYSIKFKQNYMPYVEIYAYVFDGTSYNDAGWLYCPIDEKDISMNVELKTDKTEYKPGDTVKLDVTTKDSNGNGVKSEVNISVVDEAYFAVAGEEQNSDILGAVESRDTYYIETYSSHEYNDIGGGGRRRW